MAKLRGPLFGLSAKGSVGDIITTRRARGVQVGVLFSKPEGAPSLGQSAVRAIIKALGLFWHTLSDAQKAAWGEYALSVRRRAEAYEVYTELNFARSRTGDPLLPWPPGWPHEATVWELDISGGLQLQSGLVPGVAGLFEVAVDGSVAPSGGVAADTYFELDVNSDVEPLEV